jgi:dihydroxyacetone kinase
MLDALVPAADAFAAVVAAGRPVREALASAASAAAAGAAGTAGLTPRRGRSSYLGARAVGHPDPGAEAVAVWLAAVTSSCSAPPG